MESAYLNNARLRQDRLFDHFTTNLRRGTAIEALNLVVDRSIGVEIDAAPFERLAGSVTSDLKRTAEFVPRRLI